MASIPDTDQHAQSVGARGHSSGSHSETASIYGPATSHGSETNHVITHTETLTEGQKPIRKGDNHGDQGDFDNAAKNYKLAAQFYPNEATEKLKSISLRRTTSESSISTTHSLPDHPRKRKRDKLRALFKLSSRRPTSTGPFFPGNGQSHPLLLMSQATDMPKGLVCPFDDAKDTNDVVVSFIEADDETKNTLRDQIYDIIAQFKDTLATSKTVQELVTLARIPDRDIFVQTIEKLLKITKESSLVPIIVLQGLAVAINSCPDGIDMREMQGIYLDILQPLKQRLETAQSDGNVGQLISLLHALTALINAMVCRNVHALDHEGTFNPLNSMFDGLKGHENPTVRFLALYAKQGLAYVGNDESLGMSIYRRGRLAIAVVVDIADGISNVDLEKFESAYNSIMEISGFTIPAKWYQGLIYVDCILGLQDWSRFERFVLESKLKSDECFLQGICLRLEQVAVTRSVQEIRKGAIEFLHYLSKNPSKQVRQAVTAVLERLVSSGCTKHNETNTKHHAKTIKCACATYQSEYFGPPLVWDPYWYTTSSNILLEAVQRRRQNNKNMASLIEIHAALESYYKSSLVVRRVTGDILDLEICYINLAVVEARGQREKDKRDLKSDAVAFQRIPSRGESTDADIASSMPLENLFDKRKLPNGDEYVPKRVLIHGRAGIGKSTLCKKLVHLHQGGLWRDQFDTALWLQLRQLKSCNCRNIDGLLSEKYFSIQSKSKREALSRTVSAQIDAGRVLFVLNGLDEIVTNLELETIGFSPQNVNDYLHIPEVLPPDQIKPVQEFIDRTPVIQGLVNIPIQLDAICFSWGSIPIDGDEEITVTSLYKAMVRKLWRKDTLRLGKSSSGETFNEIHGLDSYEIDELMDAGIEFLGYLAFKGLEDNY
ncbi:hypothetical protein BGZ79_008034, partial [Entomortierella chlamydospora]